MLIINNAFSLGMLSPGRGNQLYITHLALNEAQHLVLEYKNEFVSNVGHESAAKLFTEILQFPIAFNRVSWKWENREDHILVGQYARGRLPENFSVLEAKPEDIEWWWVRRK